LVKNCPVKAPVPICTMATNGISANCAPVRVAPDVPDDDAAASAKVLVTEQSKKAG